MDKGKTGKWDIWCIVVQQSVPGPGTDKIWEMSSIVVLKSGSAQSRYADNFYSQVF